MMVHSGPGKLADQVSAAIRRHQAGDAHAMSDLFRAVRPWLYNVGMACRLSTHSADDVVQSTMAVAITHLPSLRDPDAGLAWLSVIARREAIRISREERRTDPLDDRDAPAGDGQDPERIALARMARTDVLRALAQLPDRERKLLAFLFFDGGRDYASIARELRMPLGSIGPTRQRSLRKVRNLVACHGEAVPGGSS
jgi:RNA polymerase sigma factor (sigma-70 family)